MRLCLPAAAIVRCLRVAERGAWKVDSPQSISSLSKEISGEGRHYLIKAGRLRPNVQNHSSLLFRSIQILRMCQLRPREALPGPHRIFCRRRGRRGGTRCMCKSPSITVLYSGEHPGIRSIRVLVAFSHRLQRVQQPRKGIENTDHRVASKCCFTSCTT